MFLAKISRILIILSFFLTLYSCKNEIDPITGEKKRYETNVNKKVQSAVESGGGIIFGGNRNKQQNTYDFATSNVLWRASLDVISFMPLANLSYSGGVITTDWYTNDNKEMIKINIRFLSQELQTSSVMVTGFNKQCKSLENCTIVPTTLSINDAIKSKIIERARELVLLDKKKEIKKQ